MKTFYHLYVGRGGHFNNGNHKTFVGLVSEDEITEQLYLMERDANGKFLFEYVDDVGNPIISKKDLDDEIKQGYVVLDFDTIYDTDIYMTVNHIDYDDLDIIQRSTDSFDVEEAIDYFEEQKGFDKL